MAEEMNAIVIAEGAIVNKIYWIRGQKVMLDRDLAELYGVETKYLKKAVKRNIDRFPEDFMFELSKEEFENWRCQNGTSNLDGDKKGLRFQIGTSKRGGARYLPMAFTEQGVAMLSSVLNSARAITVNIQIIRIFTRMREMILNYKDIQLKLEQLERQTLQNTEDIQSVFAYLRQLLVPVEQVERERIGFRQRD
jgi:ORF6N domain-containing protein